MNRLILVSGGIGAGKSVVCRILSALGYAVYDCDSEAKRLMDNDRQLISRIIDKFQPCTEAALFDDVSGWARNELAKIVFADSRALAELNAIVHPAVLDDICRWRQKQGELCFVESAIPAESGLRNLVDEEWIVEAPRELRIERVGRRSGLSPETVTLRIEAQKSEWILPHALCHRIENDGCHSLLLQIHQLLG